MCDKPEAEILAFMVAEGYCKEAALTGCYVEDDQYNMVVCDKENHQPLYALAYGELQDGDPSKPPPGSWADVARMMAAISADDGTDWDAWKDETRFLKRCLTPAPLPDCLCALRVQIVSRC